jgi:signal transduction histidine kinase
MISFTEDKAHILLVDDEEPFCLVTSDVLELNGYLTGYALSAEQGLAYIRHHPDLDLVLLDIDLGEGMDGIEALSMLVQLYPHLPVVMVTSQKTLQVGLECMKKGAFDFLPKPFRHDDLFKLIPQALEKKRLTQLNSLYLGIIAHDLNNPLHNILMGLEVLEPPLTGRQDGEQRAYSLAKYGCWQIQNMIANLITVGQLEKRSLAALHESFCVAREVQEHLQPLLARSLFTGKKIIIHDDLKQDFQLTNSKFLFGRVITNIVANALNCTHQGDSINVSLQLVDTEIVFAHLEKGKSLLVQVTNTGSYIEEEMRNRIFDKFFKTDATEGHKGYNFGLGLTFCKLAIRSMGGEIRIEGDKDIPTTTFTFTIRDYSRLSKNLHL